MKSLLPFGTWPSDLTPEMLTTSAVGLVDVWVDGHRTLWLESRPSEGGRVQLVAKSGDAVPVDVLPDGFNVRSGVHEYGGGAAWVEASTAWFVNWSDQRIYRMDLDDGSVPVALTPEPPEPRSTRFADLRVSPDGRWLVAVRERHLAEHDVVNDLVLLDAERPSDPRRLFGGSDFVMSPRFASDDRLRWVAWDHPNMPWNETTLWECGFDPTNGDTSSPVALSSGASIMQPLGDLAISDSSGWWNLWRFAPDGTATHLHPIDAEVGGPAWVFGERSYVVLADGRLVFSIGSTVYVDGEAHQIDVASLGQLTASGTTITAIARFVDRMPAIVRFDVARSTALDVVLPSAPLALDPADISLAQQIEYPTAGGAVAYAWFYPPRNSRYEGPTDAAPPLVTLIHGGPTSDAEREFNLVRQFWTTRGFAVVDVNHRGSTGFGTAYRNLLDGNWGVVDVEDCLAAATWLADQGLVDRNRMVIRGGSAGGFTVLSCLATSDVFAAGGNLYGVADLSMLAADTHKFEARYLDRLVGPWPAARETYEQRSPIHHLDGFTSPLITFQGLDDMVVPPSQSETIVSALQFAGIDCEYVTYEGEGHGFRKAETIVDQLTRELEFYRRVLSLEP